MRAAIAVLALGFLARQAQADAVTDAADKVLAAVQAKDAAALKGLAEKDDPDPWLVADELCARAAFGEADAFAKAAPRKDVEELALYVAAQRAKPTDVKRRDALRRVNEALASKDVQRALAEAGGAAGPEDVTGVRLMSAIGIAHQAAGRWPQASVEHLKAAEAAGELGWLARQTQALRSAGECAYYGGRYGDALASWEQELEYREARSDRAGTARTLGNIGVIHESLGDYARALEYQERALKPMEEIKDRAGIAATLGNIGNIHQRLGDYARALEYQERALKLMEELGNRPGIAATLGNIGNIHQRLGDYARALEFQERALKLKEELGNRAEIAATLGNIGNIHRSLGDYARALEYQERALKLKEEIKDRAGIARTLGNIGNIHGSLGDYARALECQERALKLEEEMGNRAGIAATLGNIGVIHDSLGDYARALEYQERALKLKEELGDRAGIARTLGNIGVIHKSLGDYPHALEYQERALKLEEEIGNRAGIARTLGNIGNIHGSLGDYARALEYQERALKLEEEIKDRAGIARTLGNIGLIHESLGDYARALENLERALKLEEEMGDRAGIARTLGNIGSIHQLLGDHARALEYQERALVAAREIDARETEVHSLWRLARTHLAAGRPAEASSLAREAVTALARLVQGLGEEQGAMARERWADLFDMGVSAACSLGHAVDAAFFLESGRAGALLESLGGREALRSRAVPEELQGVERMARAGDTAARRAHERALDGGNREEIRKSRAALDAARGKLEEAVSRIQREAKGAASLVYGRVDTLDEMRGRLGGSEALLLYGPGMALVVRKAGARIVALEDPGPACEAQDWTRLRQLAIGPLELGEGVDRVFVSPAGPLAQVPFCMIAPELEVVYLPAGTTHGLLLDESQKHGEGVLALGDPDYGTQVAGTTVGLKLSPHPSTREEARAIGSSVLVGKEATLERLLSGIGGRARWRAVHLACHGLVDAEHAQLSSLALSGGGFLTVLDLFGCRIPADLVVLSACDTAKGKVYKAEGVMGFVRAFMFAGAPRVIVSLWKVDDEATKALMVKFYELWNPMDGGKGLPCATALKMAQEYVASQERWRDPKYWAAWQLWGLPD